MIKTRKNSLRKPQLRSMTETEKNGQRTAQAVSDWRSLLESKKGFAPIRSKDVKKTTAVLLENQMRWINENAGPAMNTSIFGGSNGLTGGSLGNADTYAAGDMRLPRVLLPMVRRIFPALMSNETVGVQPMMGPVALAYAIRYRYVKGANAYGDSSTEHVHADDGSAHGTRGIETKASVVVSTAATDTTDGKATVTMIKLDGYPQSQEVRLVKIDDTNAVTVPFGIKVANTVSTAAQNITMVVGMSGSGAGNTEIVSPTFENGKLNMHNSEMGYHRLDTRFTGRADARLTKSFANGKWVFRPEDTGVAATVHQFEATGAIAKTAFGFEKQAVEAGTRRLSTSWTLETQEDLKNTNGIDIDAEATQQMSYELQAEIDREMVVRMLFSCLDKGEWSVWNGQLADARWMMERAAAFYNHIVKMSIRMRVRNRRGSANFIICTPDVVAMLRALDSFVIMPTANSLDGTSIESAAVGTLGNNAFTVYVDDRTPVYSGDDYGTGYTEMFDSAGNDTMQMPNYCMLGYKGKDSYDAGIIYCPYVPIMVQTAIDPNTFAPHVGLMTRYGVMDNIFGSELYYHLIIIDNFSSPAVNGTNGVYPDGYITDKIEETGSPSYLFPAGTTPDGGQPKE